MKRPKKYAVNAPQQTTWRPFHKTIVDLIRRLAEPSMWAVYTLLALIRETEIPEGHDAIIAAINDCFGSKFPGNLSMAEELLKTKDSLLAQKQAADAKTLTCARPNGTALFYTVAYILIY